MGPPYQIKEIFYTLQGEGVNFGKAAVFCRFAGCNLWSGLEVDRQSSTCSFCDTDFIGTDGNSGGIYVDYKALALSIESHWESVYGEEKLVVCTGGEPLLQLDETLLDSLHVLGFKTAVETNGTLTTPEGIDWLTVSPKADTHLIVRSGNELKVPFPQPGLDLEFLLGMEFDHFLIQPIYGSNYKENVQAAIEFCLAETRWSLSLQMQRYWEIR